MFVYFAYHKYILVPFIVRDPNSVKQVFFFKFCLLVKKFDIFKNSDVYYGVHESLHWILT